MKGYLCTGLLLQHAPSGRVVYFYFPCKCIVLFPVECLGQCISSLFTSWNIFKFEFFFLNLVVAGPTQLLMRLSRHVAPTGLQVSLAKTTHKSFMVLVLRERGCVSSGLGACTSSGDAQGEQEINVIGLQNPSQAWVCIYYTCSFYTTMTSHCARVKASHSAYESGLKYW